MEKRKLQIVALKNFDFIKILTDDYKTRALTFIIIIL